MNKSRTKGVPDSMSMRRQIRMLLASGVTLAKLLELSEIQSKSENDDNSVVEEM